MSPIADENWNSARTWAIDIAVSVVTGAVLGVLGPFGSYFNDGVVARIAYWSLVFLASGIVYGFLLRRIGPRARRGGVPVWIWASAVVIVANLFLSVVSRSVAVSLWPMIGPKVGWLQWYGQSLLISLACTGAYLALRFRGDAVSVEASGSGALFLDRIPPRLGRELVCLQMEDHYVRVHTRRGSALILTSMRQALREIGDLEGLRTHRSWWVARHAVQSVAGDSRALRLKLVNGLEAPVARAHVARLRSEGWLTAGAAV